MGNALDLTKNKIRARRELSTGSKDKGRTRSESRKDGRAEWLGIRIASRNTT